MSSVELREKLHRLIDNADDRLLNIIHAMIEADAEGRSEFGDRHQSILEDRLEKHERDPDAGSPWAEVKDRIRANL